jgi:hypothetical protein
MKKLMFVLALIIAIVASQTIVAQEKPAEEKKMECKHEKGKTCPKCEGKGKKECKGKMECCKDKKCCDKCTGEKCDGTCCAKCAECKKECAEKCKQGNKAKCTIDSTAKCEKHDMKKMKKAVKIIEKTTEEKK